MEHFFPRIQAKTKKKVFTKNGTLFFPEFKWRSSLRRKPESNYWGNAVIDHTQIIGGDISQPIPPGSGTPAERSDSFSHLEDLTQNTSN